MSGNHDGGHHSHPESSASVRARALESLLVEKGLTSSDVVDKVISAYEDDIGPRNGAKVIARAWVDPDTRLGCSRTRRTPSRSLGTAVRCWPSWRTRRTCTTWWSAHSALATRAP